ncbi:polyserase-related [Holotrichia oblita]|uniref:Polyserase-related n=1 Tax=Holotrichia oblita TaxID=644536 RepID=A0ACB9SXQ4_HOLOL|nr:polyserase-related [Holotrichia oblita]
MYEKKTHRTLSANSNLDFFLECACMGEMLGSLAVAGGEDEPVLEDKLPARPRPSFAAATWCAEIASVGESTIDITYTNVPLLDGRIVGGSPVTIEDYPYQVFVQLLGSHRCGGAIISDRYIISAAHCFTIWPTAWHAVRAGSTFHNSGGQIKPKQFPISSDCKNSYQNIRPNEHPVFNFSCDKQELIPDLKCLDTTMMTDGIDEF